MTRRHTGTAKKEKHVLDGTKTFGTVGELIERLKALNPDLPVMVSGSGSGDNAVYSDGDGVFIGTDDDFNNWI